MSRPILRTLRPNAPVMKGISSGMAELAWLGWAAFVVSCGFAWLDRRHAKTVVEQKDNCIALWRNENHRIRSKWADSEQTVVLLEQIQQASDKEAAKVRVELADARAKLARLSPKHGKDGKFVRKTT